MPPVSEKQRRAMYAAAEGHSTLGIPKSVGEEFVGKDSKLAMAIHSAIHDASFNENEHPRNNSGQFSSGVGEGSSGHSGSAGTSSFQQAKEKGEAIRSRTKSLTNQLHELVDKHGGPSKMGLTPDHVKALPEYKKLKAELDHSIKSEQDFNVAFNKAFKKEITAERKAKYSNPPTRKEFTDSVKSADSICAGIMLRAPGPLFLLVQNADDGQWVQPGGHVEDGESLEETAQREAYEEVGPYVGGPRTLFRRSKSAGIDFTCYIQDVEPFYPEVSEESLNARWVSPDELPENTHPEVAKSIAIASGNELDIAKAIRAKEVYSPQPYENAWLFDVRITGTGTSYRQSLDEYVYRPPENFLTDEFVERCNGLPLIFEHPKSSILNTDEYRNRSIGMVILPYIEGDEVRGIAKVLDSDAAELMQQSHISTSPAVVFRDAGSTETIDVDGKKVLVEGKPSYLDHLAICEEGVWDKGGEPNGVKLQEDSTVDHENEMPAWADALVKKLDSVHARMDAIENKGGDKMAEDCAMDERKDSEEGAKEAESKAEDAEHEAIANLNEAVKEEEKEDIEEKSDARKDASEEKEEKKDARKDSEHRKDEAYMDSQKRENADLRRKIEQMEAKLKPLSHADRDALSQAQARADGVAQLFGKQVNAPLAGENPVAYRKRLAESFKKYSPQMKDVRMDSLDGAAFALVEERIYADAQSAALSPAEAPAGRLIPMVRRDSAGREITTFAGDPDAWMRHFTSTGAVCRINRAAKER